MSQFISYEIHTVETCPYSNLFDPMFIDIMKEKDSFKNSNIYFITKTKKVRFNLTDTKMDQRKNISTELIVGDNLKRVKCSESIYNLMPIFSGMFPSRKVFEQIVQSNSSGFSLDYSKETSRRDKLKVELKIEGEEDFSIFLLVENFTATCDINLENEPELLYVGQSFRMLDRIQSHKALHKAASQINDDEEIKIFFIDFKYAYGGDVPEARFKGGMWNYWLNQDRDSEDYKTKIDLIERYLIHFFKPIYNTQHVDSEMMTDTRVKDIILDNSISCMSVGLGVYGYGYEFWTGRQPFKSECFSFDFRESDKGYQNRLLFE